MAPCGFASGKATARLGKKRGLRSIALEAPSLLDRAQALMLLKNLSLVEQRSERQGWKRSDLHSTAEVQQVPVGCAVAAVEASVKTRLSMQDQRMDLDGQERA